MRILSLMLWAFIWCCIFFPNGPHLLDCWAASNDEIEQSEQTEAAQSESFSEEMPADDDVIEEIEPTEEGESESFSEEMPADDDVIEEIGQTEDEESESFSEEMPLEDNEFEEIEQPEEEQRESFSEEIPADNDVIFLEEMPADDDVIDEIEQIEEGQSESFSEEMSAEDDKLLQGLKYYYEDNFGEALEIFRELSEREETMDMMYWIGRSASKTGEYDLAIEKFKKMLEEDPNLIKVRLELAITYYEAGEDDKAREEFETIKAANPPEDVLQDVKRYLTLIGKRKAKVLWHLRFSQGYQYDSNISSGPNEDTIGELNMEKELGEKQKELSGKNWITDLRSGFFYDMGKPSGFIWRGGLNLYYSHNTEYSDFHYMNTDISTGLWWKGKKDSAKVLIGYKNKQYGEESLSNTFYVGPSWEHLFNPWVSINTGYTFSSENYSKTEYSDKGYDNNTHIISLGPNFYSKDRRQILSLRFAYGDHNADATSRSYATFSGSASYSVKLQTKTELSAFYKWTNKQYDEPLERYPDRDRHDKRNTLLAVVRQSFLKYFFASLEFAYINNDSNCDLYDFDKATGTVSLGVKF